MKLTRRCFCAGSSAAAALVATPPAVLLAALPAAPLSLAGIGEIWGLPFWSPDLGGQPSAPSRRSAAPTARPVDPFAYCC